MSLLRRKSSGRAGARAALVSGAALAALGLSALGAGSASAAVNCNGANITGAGSSLQKIAQTEIFKPGFESAICNSGTHPTISYESIGSGAGLAKWNANNVSKAIDHTVSFVASDDGPNPTQLANIESVAGGAKVTVIPVAQTAIAFVANPPAGCTVEAITNGDLTAVMEGRLSNWSKLETAEGTCNSAITRVVRKDASGTTYQTKNYLFQLYKKGLFCTTGSDEGKASWAELEPVETPNLTWPESCPEKTLSTVVRPAGTGGGEVVKTVNATAGSYRLRRAARRQGQRRRHHGDPGPAEQRPEEGRRSAVRGSRHRQPPPTAARSPTPGSKSTAVSTSTGPPCSAPSRRSVAKTTRCAR